MEHQLEIRIAYADWNAQEARVLLNEIRPADGYAMTEELTRKIRAHMQIASGIYAVSGMPQHAQACRIAIREASQ